MQRRCVYKGTRIISTEKTSLRRGENSDTDQLNDQRSSK